MTTIGTETADRDGLRYTNVAIALHWAIAALILYNLTSGLLGSVLPPGFFAFHISSGITILALTVVRIGWRLSHRPPPPLPMRRVEWRLARAVHLLLYVAMLAMPLTGWAMISASPPAGSAGAAWAAGHLAHASPMPAPVIWGLFPLPAIAPIHDLGRAPAGVAEQHAEQRLFGSAHAVGGWIALALVLLHVAGALKHQLVDRRRELARMGLGRVESGRVEPGRSVSA